MTRFRPIAVLLLTALALQVAASRVSGDAGITEFLPATRVADPTATAPAPPTATVTAPGDAAPTQPTATASDGEHDPAGSPEPTAGGAAEATPTAAGTWPRQGTTSSPPRSAETPAPAAPAPSTNPESPVVAGSEEPADSDSSATSDSATAPPYRAQVAPRTGSGQLATALALLSLGFFGAALLLAGLELLGPSRAPRRWR
ncbi:MAG: hypothetical protein RMK01_10655 [Thermomicrobium sp.]|nr:hypothetical protein [Thermomicrobium sp.]